MDPIVASHAQILAVNHSLIARAVAGIPSDDLTRQPGPHSNSMHWLIGHLALTRSGVAGLLGDTSPRPFPIPDKTMRGALAFIQFHETDHVGQLAYLRKWLGHSALVG